MKLVTIHKRDIPELRTLAMRTYTAAFGKKNKPGVLDAYYRYAFAKAHLEKQISTENSFWYFAKQEGQTLGYLKLNIDTQQTEYQDPYGLEIERLYIDIPYLRKGYGKKLIEFTINKAKELEKNYIWLGVWEDNLEAISFYKTMGFVITETHQYDMVAEIQTDFVMRLNL